MDKETFDFSEALRRMKQGKKVARMCWEVADFIFIDNDGNISISYKMSSGSILHIISGNWAYFSLDDVLATDWEEKDE